MHASIMNILALAALVLQATANIITFNNLGSDTLTLCFVANAGEYTPGQSSLGSKQSQDVSLPTGWGGQFHAARPGKGCDDDPFVIGEVNFQGGDGHTYFDVSAIDSCCDNTGDHYLYPASDSGNNSGCVSFPCNNVFNQPNDQQTKSTDDTHLICQVGAGNL
ncbi:DNase1 protein [Hyaloscypha variabilis]